MGYYLWQSDPKLSEPVLVLSILAVDGGYQVLTGSLSTNIVARRPLLFTDLLGAGSHHTYETRPAQRPKALRINYAWRIMLQKLLLVLTAV